MGQDSIVWHPLVIPWNRVAWHPLLDPLDKAVRPLLAAVQRRRRERRPSQPQASRPTGRVLLRHDEERAMTSQRPNRGSVTPNERGRGGTRWASDCRAEIARGQKHLNAGTGECAVCGDYSSTPSLMFAIKGALAVPVHALVSRGPFSPLNEGARHRRLVISLAPPQRCRYPDRATRPKPTASLPYPCI
ncbi:hypothetical protein AAFF_G00201060 [Aldrovandia affinis]|uniref:Uncharacterized protein n=1 Tax=Aldrovandia affinis TaxID=143900 RepID=A0AAD7RI46_9TELE|nr:hypothetical protein AAFF_G00201060 [Aldrovandia affinis]